MAKYRITLQPANWKPEVVKEVIAFNAKNAEDLILTYNKGCTVVKTVRVPATSNSTEQDLKDMVEVMNAAIRDGAEEIYLQQRKAFEETVKSLKGHMNAVYWAKTKSLIPEMPIM